MRQGKLIEEIGKANVLQIDYLMDAVMQRKRELYPKWELFYCAAEKGEINGPEDMLRAAWAVEQRIRKEWGR